MLVISRRIGEAVVIGPGVTVRVLKPRAHGGRCRLAIDAPPHVSVRREELPKHFFPPKPEAKG